MNHRTDRQTALERRLLQLYELALKALPFHIRRRWAADMAVMFGERIREASDRGGAPSALTVGGRELGSIAIAAFQSRVGQASGRVHRAHDAQDGSGVWRTDPVSALFIQEDRRPLKLATMGALACHFALFLVVFPSPASTDLVVPPEEPPWVLQPVPLPPPPQMKGAERVRGTVPRPLISEPTVDRREPLVSKVVHDFRTGPEAAWTHFEAGLPTRPPVATAERVRAGLDIQLPQLLQRVDPVYPELAIRSRVECTVILEAVIGRAGRIIDTTVLRGCRLGLDEAALDAVSRWQFTPPMLNGRPVEVIGTFTVRFELR